MAAILYPGCCYAVENVVELSIAHAEAVVVAVEPVPAGNDGNPVWPLIQGAGGADPSELTVGERDRIAKFKEVAELMPDGPVVRFGLAGGYRCSTGVRTWISSL